MPGSRRNTRAKHKTVAESGSQPNPGSQLDALFNEIDGAEGWNPVIDILSRYLDLPDIMTRSGLKKVHANFDSIYRRLDKIYTRSGSSVRVKGGIAGIYARMSGDSILRNKLFERGFLSQIIPLLDVPLCRSVALPALTTCTHHGGLEARMEIAKSYQPLLRLLQEFPEDPEIVDPCITILSHSLIATMGDDGTKLDPTFIESCDLMGIAKAVTEGLRKSPSRVSIEHAGQLLNVMAQYCKVPPTTVNFLIAGLRSKDWVFRCTCLGGLVRLHQREEEPDLMKMDPRVLIDCVSKPAPSHLNDILRAYGFQRCETTMHLQTSLANQRAMMSCASTRDLYTLGVTLAGFINWTEFSVSEGRFESNNPETGEREVIDVGLPFTLWSDALPHCAQAIRAKGLASQAEMADTLDMKYFIMRQRISDAVKIAHPALKRNPGFAYAYYVLTLAADPVGGLRAAKQGMKCANITPFLRFQMMQRAVHHAGQMGVEALQDASDASDQKWLEGVAFLTSALEDAKTYIAEAPPDNRNMKNVLYWYILLRIVMAEEISPDLDEIRGPLRQLKIADDFTNWVGNVPPKTAMRLTQRRVVAAFADAVEEWDELIETNLAPGQPIPAAEKVEDGLAAWLGDVHLKSERDALRHPVSIGDAHVELYRCSWCGNPSAVLRKCAGCSKTRYCDASCQKLHWKDHKKGCVPDETKIEK
ncbi:hypothetical protein C8R47DRAFT_976831 [Mycena vitilis]|nr:hypothetical protein C8R47DRAFT_976831 [Mycena vitilis]